MLTKSPLNMRQNICNLINAEIVAARAGRASGLWAKMNSLVDPDIIDKLYEASMAGVPIELDVRGICCLRPGVTGLAETIRAKAVGGRSLENSRSWASVTGALMPLQGGKSFSSTADWVRPT